MFCIVIYLFLDFYFLEYDQNFNFMIDEHGYTYRAIE